MSESEVTAVEIEVRAKRVLPQYAAVLVAIGVELPEEKPATTVPCAAAGAPLPNTPAISTAADEVQRVAPSAGLRAKI
jgi:hypothetical protein